MANVKPLDEPKVSVVASISHEAYMLLKLESDREGKTVGEILDRLILEGCVLDDELPPESHTVDLEKLNKRPETNFDNFNPI